MDEDRFETSTHFDAFDFKIPPTHPPSSFSSFHFFPLFKNSPSILVEKNRDRICTNRSFCRTNGKLAASQITQLSLRLLRNKKKSFPPSIDIGKEEREKKIHTLFPKREFDRVRDQIVFSFHYGVFVRSIRITNPRNHLSA